MKLYGITWGQRVNFYMMHCAEDVIVWYFLAFYSTDTTQNWLEKNADPQSTGIVCIAKMSHQVVPYQTTGHSTVYLNSLFRLTSKKHQIPALLVLCEGNPPVDSPHKGPVMLKAFPCHDVIMAQGTWIWSSLCQQMSCHLTVLTTMSNKIFSKFYWWLNISKAYSLWKDNIL